MELNCKVINAGIIAQSGDLGVLMRAQETAWLKLVESGEEHNHNHCCALKSDLWRDQYEDLITFPVTWNFASKICGPFNKKDSPQSTLIYCESFPIFLFFFEDEITIFRIFRGVCVYILPSNIFIQCLLYNESFNFMFSFPLSLKRMDYGKKIKVGIT